MVRVTPRTTLLLLAPVLGELASGHQTLFQFVNPVTFVLSALPYGFGALICRELLIRWEGGWLNLALLGIAYGLYEEAIVARSIWDPHWSELGALAEYTFWHGVAWTYAEVLVHFHLTISIVSSVVLAHLLHPAARRDSWLSNRELAACFLGLALWLPVLLFVNPYIPPVSSILLTVLVILGLGILAWRLPAHVFSGQYGTFRKPRWYGVVGAVNTTVVFVTVFILPEVAPSWLPPWPVTFAFVGLVDLATLWLLIRWSNNFTDWDDRHKLAFVSGLLVFYLVWGVFMDVTEGFGGSSLVAIAGVGGLYWLWKKVRARHPIGSV